MKTERTFRRATALALFALVFVASTLIAVPVLAGNGPGQNLIPLNDEEVTALNYMREEEKLARDVYLAMIDSWDDKTFAYIAVSEQQHMDTMKAKLDKYGLPDPAQPEEGVFTDPYLQEKYTELVALGSQTLVDGLYVGATIEEIDMVDIEEAIAVTEHLDIDVAYEHLLEGSKNHLRAYVNALAREGFIYEPQFISQELFDAIMGL